LKRFGERGRKFDVVILDPPSYSTTRTRFSIRRDTTRLVALAAQVVHPADILIACTNYKRSEDLGRVREDLAECRGL
jgi:23S rRNA (cytosine1962-C5)-methyltransferase